MLYCLQKDFPFCCRTGGTPMKGGCAAVTVSERMAHPNDGSRACRMAESILNSRQGHHVALDI